MAIAKQWTYSAPKEKQYYFAQLVGGPMDGHIEPLLAFTREAFDDLVREQVLLDPLCLTPFGNPPEVIADFCFRAGNVQTGKMNIYVFGSPWITEDGYLRLECVPDGCDGINEEGEFACT